jgi:hypothetical protein
MTHRRALFYLAYRQPQKAGAKWLHDLVSAPSGAADTRWLATDVVPEHRGHQTTRAMWVHIATAVTPAGIGSVSLASHAKHAKAHVVTERYLGCPRVGLFPSFAPVAGVPSVGVIMSWHQHVIEETWRVAQRHTY